MAETTQEVIFSVPWGKNKSQIHAIPESAIKIIKGVPKGGTITLSMFNMTYPGSASALIAAHRRGVNVRVLINYESGGKQYKALVKALGTNTKNRSWVKHRAGKIRMHSKFLLASESNGKKLVVWTASGNMTKRGVGQANDALITTGDKALYDFLNDQFTLLRKGTTSNKKLGRTAVTATSIVQTYPIANGGPDNDPVLDMLNDVQCVHGEENTIVRLAQLYLTDERGYLVDRLRELKAEGCDVRIIGHEECYYPPVPENLTAAGDGKIKLYFLKGYALHNKITTITGWDAAGAPLKIAMVGSHNLSLRALTSHEVGTNDELSLIIWNPDLVDQYNDYVDDVIKNHSKVYKKK